MALPSIKSSKAKLLIPISLVVVFCFVPLINMPYEVIVQKEVRETYTTIEPYTVLGEVKEPYTTGGYVWSKDRWVYIPTTRYRTVYKDVTKYREVLKTRWVSRPVLEGRTKRVSVLRYLLR